ncbi:hypothetical protein FOMPIDRAFT_1060782 [Fomitopsis schrenkii]|uniref:Uncharacterized protein n=1 Tax=Fomitopsis schrenkii TaxID=2126942 RepID=S8E2D2_FOMSC|nr:hypothetical protein FOMPIDRAFT_1060782 [Fomitopsis schrenkii]
MIDTTMDTMARSPTPPVCIGVAPGPLVSGATYKVPPEVLQEIFLRHPGYVDAENPYFANTSHKCIEGSDCGSVCWAGVAHVCQQWRAAALDCPPLWSRLDVPAHPGWMAQLLHRSGNAPLQIRAWLPDNADARADAFDLVLTQLSRIRDLQICSALPLRRTTVKLLADPAPLLRSLVLGGTLLDAQLPASLIADLDFFCCPALLHRAKTPRLLRLEIRGYISGGLGLNRPCADSLRWLKFSNTPAGPPNTWPRMADIVYLCRATPSLEALEIELLPVYNPELILHVWFFVQLPSLQLLSVTAPADECALLLTFASFPALAFLRLTTSNTQLHSASLLPALSHTLSRLAPPLFLAVYGFGANAIAPGQLNLIGVPQGTKQPAFKIVLDGCTDHAGAVHATLQDVALGDVRILSVLGARITRPDWHALAWRLDSLTHLYVHGLYAAALLPQLLRVKRPVPPPATGTDNPNALPRGMLRRPPGLPPPPDSDSGDDAEGAQERWGRVVLPHLTHLRLASSCMSTKEEYDAGVPGAWGSALCTALRRRRARVTGAGLHELHVQRPWNANKALLAALQSALGSKGRMWTTEELGEDGAPLKRVRETGDWAAFMEDW